MRVLITGGSGFLGRGIMRYAQHHWDKDTEFTVYSRDERKQELCADKYQASYVLGDVRDSERLMMATRGVDVIIHTAAIKYIPEAEFNVDECIAVNVEGTRNVLRAAYHNGVRNVVCISTDKAVQPINVYGMSKALLERMCGEYKDVMHVACARYGNVIGSTGSVIPKFRKLLADGKHITLTSHTMTRYWITIDEAVHLIDLCMYGSASGSVIIPKPRAMYMSELITALCHEVGASIADVVNLVGMRPGEKRHEQLLHEQESIRARDRSDYYELMPVGTMQCHEPFGLNSSQPEGGWIDGKELVAAAVDADSV